MDYLKLVQAMLESARRDTYDLTQRLKKKQDTLGNVESKLRICMGSKAIIEDSLKQAKNSILKATMGSQ